MTYRFPDGRWRHNSAAPELVATLVESTGLSSLMAQVLVNRNISTPSQAQIFIEPEIQELPDPLLEFPDLDKSVELLIQAIDKGEKITICGDYDADGMTSTALLLRAFNYLGAEVNYVIPSRLKEGYGINKRIVEECANDETKIILTVDNGISAYDAVQRAIDLDLIVIVTDHHDVPEKKPPAHAILNPKLLPETSVYHSLAGVGVAYILASTLAESLGMLDYDLQNQLLELFTLGTIADLAPLVGVNRRWLKKGLTLLPHSKILGVQSLITRAGAAKNSEKTLPPDDIGFKLGPRINAIGRIGDPQIVIDLLTTDDPAVAELRALECDENNTERQKKTDKIEEEAIALIESNQINWRENRVLVVAKPGWHHGVIGIVASRLVERYGAPVFIATYEENGQSLRGSARCIEEFHVGDALTYCQDLLLSFGGHKGAGGFSLLSDNLAAFENKLSLFAHSCVQPEDLKPLIKIDAKSDFAQLNHSLFQEIDMLEPWGSENTFPVFWTPSVRVLEQRVLKEKHLKLVIEDSTGANIQAIAWRWSEYFPLPSCIDIAYKLRKNDWNGQSTLQLEIVAVRLSQNPDSIPTDTNVIIPELPSAYPSEQKQLPVTVVDGHKAITTKKAIFEYNHRKYICRYVEFLSEIRIRNDRGKVLVVVKGEKTGLLGTSRENAQVVPITAKTLYYPLIKAAVAALGL